MKTHIPKAESVGQKWFLVNAENQTLGRLASRVAFVLKGKQRSTYTPHMDLGDHVVVINAEKIRFSGRKLQKKQYTRYTGYPGGLRVGALSTVFSGRPETAIAHAVKGMLPKNTLGRKMLRKLRIYTGPSHPHAAQNPEALLLNERKQ